MSLILKNRDAAKVVNRRPNCRAILMRKRSLENYLHPEAIFEAMGVQVEFEDFDSVPEVTAKHRRLPAPGEPAWGLLSRRAKKRFGNHAKQQLNTTVVDCMTERLLSESDPVGEVRSWLRTIQRLALHQPSRKTSLRTIQPEQP